MALFKAGVQCTHVRAYQFVEAEGDVCDVVQDQPPDAITQQIEAMPSELQQVLVDMQGLANVSAAEFGLLDIQQTRKNNRSAMHHLRFIGNDSRPCRWVV